MYVSFPSRIFCTWVTPLIRRGYKKPLIENDCWQLPMTERTVTVANQVQDSMKGHSFSRPLNTQTEEENRNLVSMFCFKDNFNSISFSSMIW